MQAFFSYQVDEMLSEYMFDSLFEVKANLPKEPGQSGTKDAQFFLHPVLFSVGAEFVLVRVTGDLVDGDRKGQAGEGNLLQIHGQKEVMIGADPVGDVIRMFQQKLPSNKSGLVAESHLVGEVRKGQGGIKLFLSLIDTEGISIENLSFRRGLEGPGKDFWIQEQVAGIQKEKPGPGCHADPLVHGVVNSLTRFREKAKWNARLRKED